MILLVKRLGAFERLWANQCASCRSGEQRGKHAIRPYRHNLEKNETGLILIVDDDGTGFPEGWERRGGMGCASCGTVPKHDRSRNGIPAGRGSYRMICAINHYRIRFDNE